MGKIDPFDLHYFSLNDSLRGTPQLADYYPILARAVSGLATNNAQARQEIYEHAREFLVAQLRRRDPQISALWIIGEQVILETAILRLESESRSVRERSSLTLTNRLDALRESNGNQEPTSEMVSDFASLLREPYGSLATAQPPTRSNKRR